MNFKLKPGAGFFPEGTTVKAYPRSNWSFAEKPPSGAPKGAATAEAVVGADGSAEFAGLTEKLDYYAGAEVGGVWRYVRFRTATEHEGGAAELPSSVASISTGEGAPAKGLALNTLYIQVEGSKHIALWRGKGAGEEPEQVADLSGTPADGSVTAAKVAAANVDGAVGTPGLRSLVTGTQIASTDTHPPTSKAVAEALALLAKVWRTRQSGGTSLTTAALSAVKYLLVPGQPNVSEPSSSAGNSLGQPIRVGWIAADEAIAGLSTKCKLKSECFVATAAKVTVHVALYKLVVGSKTTLGEEVAGSGKDIELGETANTGVKGESAEFTIPEDGDYCIGATVSGVPNANIGLQARLLVCNV
jgi:hypothetical protein